MAAFYDRTVEDESSEDTILGADVMCRRTEDDEQPKANVYIPKQHLFVPFDVDIVKFL